MKKLPGILLFTIGVLLIFNTFSNDPIYVSWSMLFSVGGIFMLIGLYHYARGKRLLVAIAFFTYGFLLFLDKFYDLTDNLYLNYDIDIPNFDDFFFPFIIIIIGLYIYPSLRNKNNTKKVFNQKNDVFKVEKKVERENKSEEIDPQYIYDNTLQESFSKNTSNDFTIKEKLNLSNYKRKITSELEFNRGYESHINFSKLKLDLSNFKAVDVNKYQIHVSGNFCSIKILVPRNVIITMETKSVFTNIIDNRTLLPSEKTTKKSIEISGDLLCSLLRIEEIS